MIYMTAFWLLLAVFIAVHMSASVLKLHRTKRFLEEYGILYFMMLGSLAIMAIATRDPVSIAGIDIPMEFQWLGSLAMTVFGVWQIYLNPLKDRVVKLENSFEFVKRDFKLIRADLGFIKRNLERRILKLEVGQGRIEADVSTIKSDTKIIKGHLIRSS